MKTINYVMKNPQVLFLKEPAKNKASHREKKKTGLFLLRQ